MCTTCGQFFRIPECRYDPVQKILRGLYPVFSGRKLPPEEKEKRTAKAVKLCRLEDLLERHPYDLSGGETQRLSLGKLLLRNAEVLILDEPTKGLDAYAKAGLAKILKDLCRDGVSILVVTHDVEFAATYASRCALMFDGQLLSDGGPHAFFAGNRFYTTDANRIAGELFPDAITCEEVIALCKNL